jgi:feruloyl-CoA synthase
VAKILLTSGSTGTPKGLGSASGSAARVQWLLVMGRPASLDDGEVTDKGYLNQRRVLTRRSELVDLLYVDPTPPGVISAPAPAG